MNLTFHLGSLRTSRGWTGFSVKIFGGGSVLILFFSWWLVFVRNVVRLVAGFLRSCVNRLDDQV